MLKRGFFFLLFTLLSVFGSSTPAGAVELLLEAPGGLEAGKEGSVSAAGLPGRPLRAVVGDYEFTARNLFYDLRRRTVTFSGEVLLRLQERERKVSLRAETMVLDLDRQTVKADGRVLLTGEGMTVEAESLQADLRAGWFSFLGAPAVARYRDYRFTARRIRYDRKADYLTLEEEVGWWEVSRAGEERSLKAHYGEYDRPRRRIQMVEVLAVEGAFRLEADRVVYDEKTGEFGLENVRLQEDGGRSLTAAALRWVPAGELVSASGGVVFHDGPYTVTAREAVYERAAHRIVFRQGVRLERGGDFLLGEEVQYDLDRGTMRISGGAKARITVEEGT